MACFVFCVAVFVLLFSSCAARSNCTSDLSSYTNVTFDISITRKLMVQGLRLYWIAEVEWNVSREENRQQLFGIDRLDGFAINFSQKDDSDKARPILPSNVCHASSDYMWVDRLSWSAGCESASSTLCNEESTHLNEYCLSDFTDILDMTSCNTRQDLFGPNFHYHFSVLPSIRRLVFAIECEKSYEFSITPYYWDYIDFSPSTISLEAGDECSKQKYECKEKRVSNFNFPITPSGLKAYSKETCEERRDIPKASIRCNSLLEFDESTLIETNCDSTIGSLTNMPYEDLGQQLGGLSVLTSAPTSLKTEDVEEITDFFSTLSDKEEQFSSSQVTDVVEITSHLTNYYEESGPEDTKVEEKKQDLVKSITKISRKVNQSEKFEAVSKNIHIKVEDVDTPFKYEAYFPDERLPKMTINIPSEALKKANDSAKSVRAVSVGYRSSSLFPSAKQSDWVIATSLGNETTSIEDIRLIDEKVAFTDNSLFPDYRVDEENATIECVFWNFTEKEWSSEGCELVSLKPVTCQCDHLTNFAVLVSRSKLPGSHALDIVSYTGCGISIACLFVSMIVICLSRRMRKKHQMRILGNISFCLFAGLLIFICGIKATEILKPFCSVITVFLHFFLLAAWSWMAIYSFSIYRDVARVMSSYGQTFKMYYAYAFGYGIPLLIVLLNSSIALAVIDKGRNDSIYRSAQYCWLHEDSLYFGFLLPIGIFLVFNMAVFCLVISKLTCRKEKLTSTAKKSDDLKGRLIIAIILAGTMGLSWVWGYLMLVSENSNFLLAMSWLFTLFNTLQGVFIFYVVAIRNREVCRTFDDLTESTSYDGKTASTVSTGVSPRQSTSKE